MSDETMKQNKEEPQDKDTSEVETDEENSTETEEAVIQEEKTVSQGEFDKIQSELSAVSDQLIRSQAEMQNLQRRHRQDKESTLKFRSQDLAKDIIPAIDNLERALSIEVDSESGENLKKGVQMVLDSLISAFEKNGIEEIDAQGQTFDPNFHEAYTQLPAEDGQKSGQVAQVFEKGYRLHDRVLRAAKVAVVE